ncbi:LIM domain-containing protein PLIM2b-like [Zingiber officinale]|uniref:LIM domain-containing protein PLIM2b-like n=1 Tax=Zingiber officinale TaxID=94328 RepID=UPI001C4BEFF0|nr:LIM domain-containing protein PLIM2b-like [Zingiber officinale]
MSFSGTQDKCKACDKTVHFIDLLTADGVSYHKTCFKCSHCKGTLSVCNYSSMEGVLYCKPHFEQLFKETGTFSKKFPASGDYICNHSGKAPSKVSSMFSGTQDKCASCNKTAYPLEKISVEGEIYHKTCFRCFHGGCTLTPSSYAALDGVLYCKHHFAQLFKEKGSYNHLTQVAMKRRASEDSSSLDEAAATVSAEAEAEEEVKADEEH